MDVVVTINYSSDDYDFETGKSDVNESISALLENTLPYMVDNVSIEFDIEE